MAGGVNAESIDRARPVGKQTHGFSKVSPAVLQPPSAAAVIAANALGDEGWERVNGTLERPCKQTGKCLTCRKMSLY